MSIIVPLGIVLAMVLGGLGIVLAERMRAQDAARAPGTYLVA